MIKPVMIIRLFFTALCCFSMLSCSADPEKVSPGEGGIRWLSFEQAVALNDSMPKKIFIDVYTEWCGWCKRMDAGTFRDSAVISYMNEHYYAVKVDAESKDTVRFRDKQFVFRPEFKANELALSLLNGKMAYPSFVIMSEQYVLLAPLSGYQQPDELMQALTFYGQNIHEQMKWEDYIKQEGK